MSNSEELFQLEEENFALQKEVLDIRSADIKIENTIVSAEESENENFVIFGGVILLLCIVLMGLRRYYVGRRERRLMNGELMCCVICNLYYRNLRS